MKRIILSILISAFIGTRAAAESSVWKAQKDDSVIYFGGTVHILRPSDLPLPEEFDTAYAMSDVLVFETDLGKAQTPATQQKIMARAVYTDGSTINEHLSPETYNLLVEHAAKNNIPMDSLKSFKPSMIALMLTMIELRAADIMTEGVDLQFYKRAMADKKPVAFLETIDEQIQFLTEMGEGNEDTLIKYTIRDIKKTKTLFEDIITAWKSGDANRLNILMNAEIEKMPELYDSLLAGRNRTWLSKIEAYEASPEKEFILVGAGHIIGPKGLLQALEAKGFSIEQVQAEATTE